jgi:hypothetical protein
VRPNESALFGLNVQPALYTHPPPNVFFLCARLLSPFSYYYIKLPSRLLYRLLVSNEGILPTLFLLARSSAL